MTTAVRIIKQTAWGAGVIGYELNVDTANADQFKIQVLRTGSNFSLTRVQRYDSEGSRLFLRRARKTKSRTEAVRLATDFMTQHIQQEPKTT